MTCMVDLPSKVSTTRLWNNRRINVCAGSLRATCATGLSGVPPWGSAEAVSLGFAEVASSGSAGAASCGVGGRGQEIWGSVSKSSVEVGLCSVSVMSRAVGEGGVIDEVLASGVDAVRLRWAQSSRTAALCSKS